MAREFTMAIDSGTTGTTVLILDRHAQVIGRGYHEMPQHYPKPGWVEHDPEDIYQAAHLAAERALKAAGKDPGQLSAIGITNQRETSILWDRKTGKAVHRAIVWQCRRSAPICERLKSQGLEAEFRARTGLVVDAYFSGTKLTWLFEEFPELRERAKKGELAFGTVDTWLLNRLTEGRSHKTDHTNASRTLMYNVHQKAWDPFLLEHLGVPESVLPQVQAPASDFGHVTVGGPFGVGVAVAGMAGDQQSALFGQGGYSRGDAKNTYGTGCFMLLNTGEEAVRSTGGLLTSLGADRRGQPCYVLEGAVFVAGAAVQWLRDGLKLIQSAKETEAIAREVSSTDGVYLVPAFTGLGAPHWDPHARGAFLGLTRGTGRAHIVRATLESMAYQVHDVVSLMEKDTGLRMSRLRVDGGAAENDFLMQFQADILGMPVDRPTHLETTAFGAAFLAGIQAGLWDAEDLPRLRQTDRIFEPGMASNERQDLLKGWSDAVGRTLTKK